MTTTRQAAEKAWIKYHGAKYGDDIPELPPIFLKAFKDGIEYHKSVVSEHVTKTLEKWQNSVKPEVKTRIENF